MKTDNLTSTFMALRDKLHRSALRFLSNDEEARDALQDTYLRLWAKGPVESDAEARNKLFAVLRNICIDRLRRPPSVPISESDTDGLQTGPPTARISTGWNLCSRQASRKSSERYIRWLPTREWSTRKRQPDSECL